MLKTSIPTCRNRPTTRQSFLIFVLISFRWWQLTWRLICNRFCVKIIWCGCLKRRTRNIKGLISESANLLFPSTLIGICSGSVLSGIHNKMLYKIYSETTFTSMRNNYLGRQYYGIILRSVLYLKNKNLYLPFFI